MTCKWDREAEDYLSDGKPCRVDDYGDPTRHCTARRTCSNHVGVDELTCARCLTRTRNDIRRIRDLAPLMMPVALGAGVNSEAANMAGPAADYEVFSARRLLAKRWIQDRIHQSARGWCDDADCTRRHFKANGGDRWHKRGIENALSELIPDDDEFHPYSVLTRWEFMLREDYDQRRDDQTSITSAADYLDRVLHRVAQDEGQDFPLLAREVRKCRTHLENVMTDSRQPERGAPCPECGKPAPRLVREYAHWCEDPDCERLHYDDDTADVWRCPRNKSHEWSEEDYRLRIADWYDETRQGA